MPAFDLRFNFLGGGDTDFFYRCLPAGMHVSLGGGSRHQRDRAAEPDQA